MPGRLNTISSTPYRFGQNAQEKDPEIFEGAYAATYWEYDSRLGRRWNIDPKPTVGISDYACFLDNPVEMTDPDGDEVKYDKFRDRVNAFFGRVFNKGFREKFKKWDESADIFTLSKSKDFGHDKLVNADVCEGDCINGIQQNSVYYDKGFTTNDISSKGLRLAALPFDLAFNIAKLPFAALSGITIGIHNIFSDSKHDIGWGWGNRIELSPKNNILSWGFGNFNKYNMFGRSLSSSGFGSKRIIPHDGLIGIRVGVGKLRPPNFIDLFPQIDIISKDRQYHFHINAASKSKRNTGIQHEDGIDLKN